MVGIPSLITERASAVFSNSMLDFDIKNKALFLQLYLCRGAILGKPAQGILGRFHSASLSRPRLLSSPAVD